MTISATSQGLKPGVCTSSNRPANPYDGMMIYETDTDRVAVYDSSAWVYKTGKTASGLRVVTDQTAFSAVNSVSISNCFSSTYDKYLVLVRWTNSSTGELAIQLQASGTAATTNYNYQLLEINNTTVAATRTTSGGNIRAGFSTNGTYPSFASIVFDGPYLADQTSYWIETAVTQTGATTVLANRTSGNHTTATSYDGFTMFTTAAQTITGNYTVYGYAK